MKTIEHYKNLERESHISFDDVLHKVTQEVGELIEAIIQNDRNEIYAEAEDVFVNVCSVAEEMGIELDTSFSELSENPLILPQLLGKWNDAIQTLRGKYTRKDISHEAVQGVTQEFISTILGYVDPCKSSESILQGAVSKIQERSDIYKPDIELEQYIMNYPDFPKPGIEFKDISPLLGNADAMRFACSELANHMKDADVIAGLDARGFLFGSLISEMLGKPFVMIRKKGKLPGKTQQQAYGLEYGKDIIEIQEGKIESGQKVALVDDLLATGGTIGAAINLIESQQAQVESIGFVVSLNEKGLSSLPQRKNLETYNVKSLVEYD